MTSRGQNKKDASSSIRDQQSDHSPAQHLLADLGPDALPMDLTNGGVVDPLFGDDWLSQAIGELNEPSGAGASVASHHEAHLPLPPTTAHEIITWSVATNNAATTTTTTNNLNNDKNDEQSVSVPNRIAESSRHASSVGSGASTPDLGRTNLPAKIGTRFSKEALRILRRWLSANSEHPYPNEEEKHLLQEQTGLNRTQIANWLANARRRGLVQTKRVTHGTTSPIDIPRRPATPAQRQLNPLERWYGSPPEDEAASASDIARAIAAKHTGKSTVVDLCEMSQTDLGPEARSPAIATSEPDDVGDYLRDIFRPSSTGTSRSSLSSFSSVNSYNSYRRRVRHSTSSRGSSASSASEQPIRRRKRRFKKKRNARTSLGAPLNRYQCTFCTETFRTKHDWQRHEKALHLPLERWACSPTGPTMTHHESGQTCCAFCGILDPNDAHIEHHNPSLCRERTFGRKDHLKQHLRLVHNTMLVDWLADQWKLPSPQIRSKCGLCGLVMESWEYRIDHLADHFKMGQTMAEWKGDWGFEPDVLQMVENSIPPYLIDSDQKTPDPFRASNAAIESPRYAFELIQSELTWFLHNHDFEIGGTPDHDRLQLEACRIIFAAEVMMVNDATPNPQPASWLRDLITSREDIAQQAQFGPIRSQPESALSVPKLHGKRTLFEDCPLEKQLRDFVQRHWLASQKVLSDPELQVEACRIISSLGSDSSELPSNVVTNWLIVLIGSSTTWLVNFRKRAYDAILRNTTPHTADVNTVPFVGDSLYEVTGHNFTHGVPSGQARAPQPPTGLQTTAAPLLEPLYNPNIHQNQQVNWFPFEMAPVNQSTSAPQTSSPTFPDLRTGAPLDHRPSWVRNNLLFLNDRNFHQWLARELGRWVVATMSPNNPNRHTPSDEELRHQARCILYDDDDPFNPTAADNAEWLRRFRRDFGIPNESG